MRIAHVASLFSLPALLACTGPVSPAGDAVIDDGFARGGAVWGTGARVEIALDARERDGGLVVCGAWTVHGETAQTVFLTPAAVATGVVQLDKRTVLRDPTRFPRLPDGAELTGARAACLSTGLPWREEYATAQLEASFVRQVYDHDEEGLGGQAVVFAELPTRQGG